MYSVVLMMALSGGAEATEFGRGCHGCTSSCTSSCKGCHGLFRRHSCHGCTSCTAKACNGCTAKACHGCHGLFRRHHNHCCGTVAKCTGCAGTPAPAAEPKKMPEPAKKVQGPAAATIVVTLPADARLSVDGTVTSSKSERRVLLTPVLEQGAEYSYTLTAEVVQDGQTVAQTQVITVRPGRTTEVNFNSQSVASR